MPLPYDYNRQKRRFVDASGRTIPLREVRAQIDKLTAFVQQEARALAAQFEAGRITLAEFELGMRELLKSGHIIAASVGRGGRKRLTQADWGRVGAKVKWQYEFLAKFTRKIGQGKISKILTANRAQKYASALRITFYQTFGIEREGDPDTPRVRRILNAQESCEECVAYADMGFIPVDEMPELGELECGDFCKCDLEFEND